MGDRFDPDLLDEDPFEVDAQAAHLFRHPHLGLHDVYDVWRSDPLFYPARPPAHWLMVGEVGGVVLPTHRVLRGSLWPRSAPPEGLR